MGWQEDLPEKTQEFLKEFGISFAKYYGVSMVVKVQKNINLSEDTRQLSYRDWDSVEVPPDSLARGTIFMREGDGAASWRAWRQCYIVQTKENNFDVFPTEKDYEKDPSKPKQTVRPAGYTFLNSTQTYYLKEGREVAAELGGSDPEIGHSSYAWGLAHPVRPQFMFQMHKGKNPMCACIGGNAVEPEDAGAEFAKDRDEWVAVFEHCVNNSSPRDLENDVIAATFERVKNSMANTIEALNGYSGDGTEGEMLADMIYLAVVEASCKAEIMAELEKLPPGFRYPAWIKAKGLAVKIIQTAVPPAWKEIQNQMKKLNDKIEPTISKGIEKILTIKEKIKAKILEATAGQLGEALAKLVSPHLEPVFKALDQPLRHGFAKAGEIFRAQAGKAASKAPGDRTRFLDSIARNDAAQKPLQAVAAEMAGPAAALQKIDAEVFQDLDPKAMESSALQLLLETLDAACFSMEEALGAAGAPDFATCLDDVAKRFEHDTMVQLATWMKTTINGVIGSLFKRTVGTYADPIIDSCQSEIPEDLKEIIDIRAEYDSIVDGFLQEPINKIVDAAYPTPNSGSGSRPAAAAPADPPE